MATPFQHCSPSSALLFSTASTPIQHTLRLACFLSVLPTPLQGPQGQGFYVIHRYIPNVQHGAGVRKMIPN